MNRPSRRDLLAAGSLGIVAGLAGCAALGGVPGARPTDTPDDRVSKAELVDRIEELEAELASKNERIEALESRSESPSNRSSEFSTNVLERAEETARAARNAVVVIRGESGGSGTGWVLDGDEGYVVTNSHVVARDDSVSIETFDGEAGNAVRVGYHEDLIPDVAVVRTDLDGLPALPTGGESTLDDGDPLMTVGHPGRIGEWVMTIGRHRSHPMDDWLLSSVPTSQGNSGGPLLTLEGSVVGVVSGTTTLPGDGDDYSRSDELYTQLPEIEKQTTSVPATTLLEWVDEWT